MIIKVDTISSSHGHNAIDYSLEKDVKDEARKPEFLKSNCLNEYDPSFDLPSPFYVWDQMKLREAASRHRVADPFFRIEICPPMDKCRDWSNQEWEQLLDDVIRHLDSTDYRGKGGKVLGRRTDLAHCQWVAALHRDTDNYHIHLIANRITEDDRIQDGHRCMIRGQMAADALAQERGWTKAKDMPNKRIERIHEDAMQVLRAMPVFDLNAYFDGMRQRGWIIDPKIDTKGVCRGYTIGEHLYKADGSLSSTITLKASDLKHGRDLMVSKLETTWKKLHPSPRREVSRSNLNVRHEATWEAKKSSVPYVYEGKTFEIPEHIDRVVKSNITIGKPSDYAIWESYPTEAEIATTAAAIFAGLLAPDNVQVGGGGGGPTSGWGKDKDDEEWAVRCARMASARHQPQWQRKKGKSR